MTKKIIFFDIDGTLLDDEKKLPDSAFESVQNLQDKGHIVAIATGRAPFTFEDLREKLGISTYVSLNGSYVVHDHQVVYKNPLHFDELEKLTQLSTERDHPLIYVNGEGWESTVAHHPHVKAAIDSLKVDKEVQFNPNAYKMNEKYQALLFCEATEEALYTKTFQQFDFVRWHDYSIDILPKGGSKAVGIQKVLDVLALDHRDAYAFGDGLNDREMLAFIPNSVAMGNALDKVKQAAQHITKDVDQDGIYLGLRKLGLI